MKCDICGLREQTGGGFISGGGGSSPSITRTCDDCYKLTFEEAISKQQYRMSCITFAGDGLEEV